MIKEKTTAGHMSSNIMVIYLYNDGKNFSHSYTPDSILHQKQKLDLTVKVQSLYRNGSQQISRTFSAYLDLEWY